MHIHAKNIGLWLKRTKIKYRILRPDTYKLYKHCREKAPTLPKLYNKSKQPLIAQNKRELQSKHPLVAQDKMDLTNLS